MRNADEWGYGHAARQSRRLTARSYWRSKKDCWNYAGKKPSIDGYVVTKSPGDFGMAPDIPNAATRVLHIPAPLLCYWMSTAELAEK